MKIVAMSGSKIGTKTSTAMKYTMKTIKNTYPHVGVTFMDLAEYDVQFSDGRHYLDYEGDTKYVTQLIMRQMQLLSEHLYFKHRFQLR